MTVYSDVCASEARHTDFRRMIAEGELVVSNHGLSGAAVVGLRISGTHDESDDVVISRENAVVRVNDHTESISHPVTALVTELLRAGVPVIRRHGDGMAVFDARDIADEWL